jgi:flagella basal body P-ring formation protein FlgA
MRWVLILLALAAPLRAETLVAARTVRAMAILTPADLAMIDTPVVGALSDPGEAIGLEARTILYEGRPIRPTDVGPAAIVDRNAIVVLVFRSGGLTITAEGRAMGRAGAGDPLRVMNLDSRTTVTGIVAPDGRVIVGSLSGS